MKKIKGSQISIKRYGFVVLRRLFLAMIIFSTSCRSLANELMPEPPDGFTAKFVPLDRQTVYQLEEIDRFALNADHLSVRAIRYSALTNQLLGVSEGDGRIAGWDMSSKELVLETNVQLPNFTPIDFDKEGKLLLAAIDSDPENFFGIGIWDVMNGELVECEAHPCDESVIKVSDGYPGAIFDPDAEYAIIFDDSSYGVSEILGSGFDGGGTYVNSPDADYWWTIGDIAIDTNNDRLAIVFQEGKIWLDEVDYRKSITVGPLAFSIPIANGKKHDLQTIYAAEFDATGEWLAVVRGTNLLIYQVWKYGGKLVSEYHVGQEGLRSLHFNPTSELLFVAGEDAIKVISLKNQKELIDLPASGVTAITISDDNRLLIWGDKEGAIHLWGVLKQ